MKKIHLSVVSYLPKDLTREAKKMTNILSEKFETYTSKDKWDPHLTVGSGFYVPENKLNELFSDLENLLDKFSKFKIKIKGIESDGIFLLESKFLSGSERPTVRATWTYRTLPMHLRWNGNRIIE